jgi:Putative transmembrane protein (PGPGW)
MHHVMRLGRRIAIGLAGGLVLAAGVAMLVLPGPGIVVIALGLAILSLEFERPRVWLARLKAKGTQLKQRLVAKRSQSGDP